MVGLSGKGAAASSLAMLAFPGWQRRCVLLTYSGPGRAAGVAAGYAGLLFGCRFCDLIVF